MKIVSIMYVYIKNYIITFCIIIIDFISYIITVNIKMSYNNIYDL